MSLGNMLKFQSKSLEKTVDVILQQSFQHVENQTLKKEGVKKRKLLKTE